MPRYNGQRKGFCQQEQDLNDKERDERDMQAERDLTANERDRWQRRRHERR